MPEPTPVPTPSADRATRPSTLLPGATHRTVDVPGGRIHCVEQGTGPLVLLVHGFPESWYSWRHQLPALAAAGHRAVAIDVRGYGRSSAPAATDAYRMLAHVADSTAVVHALGEETATVVGHDWGSPIAANSALLRPDVFTAVGLLSVPYAPRGGPRPTDGFAGIGGGEEFYVSYFQAPGRAEAEIEPDVRGWLAGFYAGLSGDTHAPADHPGLFFVPPGARMADRFPAGGLPAGSTSGTSTSTARSSNAPASPARSTAIATSTGTGRTSPPGTEYPSPSPRSSSAAPWTPPPPGCPTPSTPTRGPSPACPPPISSKAAATGSSRNAPTRSTAC